MAKQSSIVQFAAILMITIGLAGFVAQSQISQPASIISVSSISMDATGAQIGDYVNNDYRKLSGGYWAITLSVNSYQSVYAIKFGPQNVTGVTLNGQKVIANRVVQFNIDPQDPYLLMNLVNYYQGVQFTPSASGQQVISSWPPITVTTDPSLVKYLIPQKLSLATIHCPFKIDVLVAGGQVGTTSQDPQATGTSSWTLSPSGGMDAYQIPTAYGTAVLQFHGYLSSPVTLPFGLDRLSYFPYDTVNSITDSAGKKYLVVLDAEDKVLTGYRQYWFKGLTTSTTVYGSLTGMPQNLLNAPGWAYTEFHSVSLSTNYLLYPLKANITGREPGGSYYTLNPGWLGDYIKQVSNPRSGLLDWLVDQNPSNVVNMMAYFQSWTVENPDGNNARLNAKLPQGIFTPVITILIPFDMADTLVYSPKVTTFRIDSVSNPTELRAGGEATLTVKVTNTGNTRGTGNIKVIPDANLNVYPLASQVTLDPNTQGSVDFLIRTGSIKADVTSAGKVEVYNAMGVLCDSKSFSILLKPLLSRLYISGMVLDPIRLSPGGSAKLTVKVTNQGGGGSARGTVKIVTDNFLTAPIKEKSADIASGVEYPFEFSLSAGTATGVSSLRVELYDQDGKLLESQTLSVVVSSDPPSVPPVGGGNLIADWWIWAALGLTGVGAIAVGLYMKMKPIIPLGFGLIITAIVGYVAQPILLSSITAFGLQIPVSLILAGTGLVVLLLSSVKVKIPKVRVKRR